MLEETAPVLHYSSHCTADTIHFISIPHMPGKRAYKSEAEKQTSLKGHLHNVWGGHTYTCIVTAAIQQWLQALVCLPTHLQGIHMNLVDNFAVNR